MDETGDDVRWKQRFHNYQRALATLRRGLDTQKARELSELERGGLIQAFEFTQELSWKVLKDFIEYSGGGEKIYGSRDAIRQAFNRGLISDGETWMEMIRARNLSSHTYEEADSVRLARDITERFAPCFSALETTLNAID
ncbi:MAG: nucleotidyltransferase substrate binding protein [Treponemataceae bacterium]|nr:nucleotidyltransferase substrate binding protein [Treponemataceae bacterium]